nr:hypothetical protein CFP56_57038 [Quercus suber]
MCCADLSPPPCYGEGERTEDAGLECVFFRGAWAASWCCVVSAPGAADLGAVEIESSTGRMKCGACLAAALRGGFSLGGPAVVTPDEVWAVEVQVESESTGQLARSSNIESKRGRAFGGQGHGRLVLRYAVHSYQSIDVQVRHVDLASTCIGRRPLGDLFYSTVLPAVFLTAYLVLSLFELAGRMSSREI